MKEPLEIVQGGQAEERAPDPWGVRRAEMLLQSLKGVKSARVVVSPDGEIIEIHVLTESGLTPKQVVRNVESALLAQLGIKVDHRRISVAQTDVDVFPLEGDHAINGDLDPKPAAAAPAPDTLVVNGAPAASPSADELERGRVVFHHVEVSNIKPNKVRVTVSLEYMGQKVSANEDAADTPNMRLQAAARAAASALDEVVEEGTIDLVGARFVEAFDTTFVFVGVSVLTGRDTALHTGTCEVRRGAEQAAALGVLDATNRWLRGSM